MTDILGSRLGAFVLLAATLLSGSAGAEVLRPQARPAPTEARAVIGEALPPPITLPEARETPRARPDAGAPEPEAVVPVSLVPPDVGPETNLPLPRYVSLKTDEGNVRRGPSLSHRIDWVFVRRGMPLQVTAEYGHWRRVIDRDGVGGWVHYALLSGNRTVVVDADMLTLHRRADPDAPVTARLERGVIARLDECEPGWCRIAAGGYRGWVRKTSLWGVAPDEIRD